MGSCCSTDDNGRASGADLKKPLTTAAASPPPLQAVQSPAVEADNVEVSVPSVSEVREGGVDCDKAEMNTSAVPLATDIDWTPEEVFYIFDADGSNDLDIDELIPALTATLAKKITKIETEKIMRIYDTDGDFRLNIDEFVSLVKAMKSQMKTTKAKLARIKVSRRENKKATKDARENALQKFEEREKKHLNAAEKVQKSSTAPLSEVAKAVVPDFTVINGEWRQVALSDNFGNYLKQMGAPWPIRKMIMKQEMTQTLEYSPESFSMTTWTKRMGDKTTSGRWNEGISEVTPRGEKGTLTVTYEIEEKGVVVKHEMEMDEGNIMRGRRYVGEDGRLRLVMGPSETKKGEVLEASRIFERKN